MATMPKVLLLPVSESLAAQIAAELVRKWIADAPSDLSAPATPAPPIGSELVDGTYAGVTLHNGVPMRLVLLPGDYSGTWDDARAWATERDGELPSRIDQLVLWQNLREQFQHVQHGWYWSSEQFAPDAGHAWCQYFPGGTQTTSPKSSRLRARAVRRLPL